MVNADTGKAHLLSGNSVLVQAGVSVIICCHNSEARLPETLSHLAHQKIRSDIPWEVLVIDNACTDATAQVAQEIWPQGYPAPLRILSEPKPGKTYALLRGFSAATYEFLNIIDDDNWVCEDWVELVYTEMLAHPDVGILGGSSSPVSEVQLPEWFHRVKILYAISPDEWQTGEWRGAIWGAGMVVRRSAWRQVEEYRCPHIMSGRVNKSLAAAEDIELCYQVRLAGWKLWYESSLHFDHFLPANRLRWEYARRLFYGDGESSAKVGAYERSLDGLAKRQKPAYKYSWFWKLLTAVKDLWRHPVAVLRAALLAKEGDPGVLALAHVCGRIAMLVRLRDTYNSHILEVEGFAARVAKSQQKDCATYATRELARHS